MEYIRVLLKTSDYGGIFHDQVVLTCDTDYTVVVSARPPPSVNRSFP